MLEISLSIAAYVNYSNAFVEIPARPYEIAVPLPAGTHTFKSDNFEIGTILDFEDRRLMARVQFKYSYDETAHVITVCGTDFASADAISLVTFPEGASEYCTQRAVPAGFPADDLTANPHWNYRTPLMPGVEDVLRGLTRQASDALIAALRDVDGLAVRVRTDPPALSADDYRKLMAVYRDGVFRGFYGDVGDYSAGDVVLGIESTFGGEVTFNWNEAFANVIGSSGDPTIGGLSWIRLWAGQFGYYPTLCTSDHFKGFPCGNTILGGHVIVGKQAKEMPAGSNSVYIMPICIQHNNNDYVYMEALTNVKGIWLKNYLY